MSIQNYFGKPNFELKNNHMIPCFEYFDLKTIVEKSVDRKLKCYHNTDHVYYFKGLTENNKIKFEYYRVSGGCVKMDVDETSLYMDYQPHIDFKYMKPVIQELYEHDDQLLENQKLMMNQITSLQETVKLLRKQNEDDQKRLDKLEKDYQQLLINWTTITDYMKRIDAIETKLFSPPRPKKAD